MSEGGREREVETIDDGSHASTPTRHASSKAAATLNIMAGSSLHFGGPDMDLAHYLLAVEVNCHCLQSKRCGL